MEMPRAWSEMAVRRRVSLALLGGALLTAVAASCEALPIGPGDRKAIGSAGRLANHLDLHANHCAALALSGVEPRKYNHNGEAQQTHDLQLRGAA